MRTRLPHLAVLLSLVLCASCTIVRVDSESGPPRIESRGLVEAHAAVGIAQEEHLLHLELFDGSSPGAIGELVLWKLLRVEVGVAGASLSVGPLHLGLGVLAYEPRVPPTVGGWRERDDEQAPGEHEHADDDCDCGE